MNITLLRAALLAGILATVLVDDGTAGPHDGVPGTPGCCGDQAGVGPAYGPEGGYGSHGPALPDAGHVSHGGGSGGHWQPGGYEPRSGSPYYYTAGPQYGWHHADPYTRHFGPGYYRNGERMHFRFPYYTYRAPWYNPGQPVYNRDTNMPW